jgi:hypothetical protein
LVTLQIFTIYTRLYYRLYWIGAVVTA